MVELLNGIEKGPIHIQSGFVTKCLGLSNVKIMTRASGNPGGGFGDSGCRVYDRLASARVTHVTARRLVVYFVKIMIIILK